MSSLTRHEQAHFDRFWTDTRARHITASLELPGIELRGKRVLICSCGSGEEPVRAFRAGAAHVCAFDISTTAVAKANEVAAHNDAAVHVQVMDFHALAYPTGYFDVIYGSAILHHVDCERAGRELWRCLRPGGVAYFAENSDRNPFLRWTRRLLFGAPGGVQRSRALVFHRVGTPDEYPLTDDELRVLDEIFSGGLGLRFPRFVFFELLSIHGWRHAAFLRMMQRIDGVIYRWLPWLRRYSFVQDVVLIRPVAGATAALPRDTARLR